jgi:capsular polysaccharide transport system ATP-binding protein
MGQGGLEGTLSGRQNAKFVCRVHGHRPIWQTGWHLFRTFPNWVPLLMSLVSTYSSGMRSRLQFGLSLAFDFDVYISDEVTAAGDAAFRQKAANAFKSMTSQAGLIMVAHDEGTPGFLPGWCLDS